jgi:D-alanyl-lipoteichoic acid acyltransferase DltB (MBOAT superfamily)
MLGSVIAFLNLFSLNIPSVAFNILLPVGISFYTFQTLSYVIDVYRGDYKAEKHFGYYALFVSYFPQLVAGPIERIDNLLPQIKAEHKLNAEDMYAGFKIALGGFFRKCVVADFCGIFVNNVFGNVAEANALSVFIAGVLFAIQMYNDFAGYSDIATGVARMMGVKSCGHTDR